MPLNKSQVKSNTSSGRSAHYIYIYIYTVYIRKCCFPSRESPSLFLSEDHVLAAHESDPCCDPQSVHIKKISYDEPLWVNRDVFMNLKEMMEERRG